MSITGSCLCGAVTFEVLAPLEFSGNCHCRICRKAHGAAFTSWGIVKPGTFNWTSGEASLQGYESSRGRDRWFCRECGSHLASSHSGVVGEVVLGAVEGDPGSRPREHVFVGSKAAWHEISDSLPQHQQWPPGFGAGA